MKSQSLQGLKINSCWIHSATASVTWKDKFFTFTIKADQLHLGHKIYIPLSDEHFCPFSAMQKYVHALHFPDYTEIRAQYLFTLNDGSPRNRNSCLKYLWIFLHKASYLSEHFNTHYFHIGVVTSTSWAEGRARLTTDISTLILSRSGS